MRSPPSCRRRRPSGASPHRMPLHPPPMASIPLAAATCARSSRSLVSLGGGEECGARGVTARLCVCVRVCAREHAPPVFGRGACRDVCGLRALASAKCSPNIPASLLSRVAFPAAPSRYPSCLISTSRYPSCHGPRCAPAGAAQLAPRRLIHLCRARRESENPSMHPTEQSVAISAPRGCFRSVPCGRAAHAAAPPPASHLCARAWDLPVCPPCLARAPERPWPLARPCALSASFLMNRVQYAVSNKQRLWSNH